MAGAAPAISAASAPNLLREPDPGRPSRQQWDSRGVGRDRDGHSSPSLATSAMAAAGAFGLKPLIM